MHKLKAAVRLRKSPEDTLSPPPVDVDIQATASLKRSNAKLRRRTLSSVSTDNEQHDLPEAIHSPKLDDMFRFGLDSPVEEPQLSRKNSWDPDNQEILPFGKRTPSHKSDEANNKAFSKIFSKMKGKQKRALIVDNFTKWDNGSQVGRYGLAPHPSNTSPGGAVKARTSAAMSERSSAHSRQQSYIADPFEATLSAQEDWAGDDDLTNAARANHITASVLDDEINGGVFVKSKGKGKMPAIRDIDWSKYDDTEMLSALVTAYNNDDLLGASPTDSGVGMLEEDEDDSLPAKRKYKLPNQDLLADEGESHKFDELLAMEMALQQEIEAGQRLWSDRARALELQKEQELERQRQEEEDRQRALEVQKEQELERQRQEEEDRQRAQALQEEEERIAAELARKRDCVCCGDTKDKLEFPAQPATSQCEHDSQTCSECMHTWLGSEFTEKGCAELKCPECPATLSYEDMQRSASDETFDAYEKLLTRTALASLDEFSWCLNAGCNSGQLNMENNNFMDCVSCGYKQCLEHKCAWHTGETCEAYAYRTSGQKQKDEEEATEKILDSISKKCPGENCGWRIQKKDGCDHMTCKKCKFEFCWECLASHREIKKVGNTAHQSWCKFHSDNLETSWPFNAHA